MTASDGGRRRVAVIGAGWAGLAAAVEATRLGDAVCLYDSAPDPGGRARQVPATGVHPALDNGQHILIGAYTATLALMRQVGVDPDDVLLRRPLSLAHADGRGLSLPAGPAVPAFVRAVLGQRQWRLADRLALLAAAVGWRLRGFRCPPELTVARLTRRLSPVLRAEVIDPLCVAALNTPSDEASAAVFLRVVRDALFAGPGAADLLLPRRSLGDLLPAPALRWLTANGARIHLGRRVRGLTRPTGDRAAWGVDDLSFDTVVLACTSTEAARLVADIAPAWAATSAAIRHEPISTVYLQCDGTHLPSPMLALHSDDIERPAQFVFDHGQLGGPPGRLAAVISGAAPWVARGNDATLACVVTQLRSQLGMHLKGEPALVRLLTDKRATFRCTPDLKRPPMQVADRLVAAGDYVEGPYPATLEGAVRSGLGAARSGSVPGAPGGP